jgi:hypothetical protein
MIRHGIALPLRDAFGILVCLARGPERGTKVPYFYLFVRKNIKSGQNMAVTMAAFDRSLGTCGAQKTITETRLWRAYCLRLALSVFRQRIGGPVQYIGPVL